MMSLAKRLLNKLGILNSGISDPPYEYLLTIPRYTEITVKLLAQDFRIADPASFYWNYRDIFIQETYKFESSGSSPLIIDCGANYGTSILYFKKTFPAARIIGIEADPDIFKILESNIERRGLKNIELLNRAVSSGTRPIKFYSEGADGGRVHFLEGARKVLEVETIRLDDLLWDEVDFLKVDIEGAETGAICSCEKLANVRQLFIEYHSFRDSPQTLAELLFKLTQCNFRYYIHTGFCSPRPLLEERVRSGQDMQLNIFAKRVPRA